MRAAALDPNVDRAAFEAAVDAAMLRHPAEPYLPFTGALRAVRAGDASLLPWIERTLDRALVYGPAHLLLARWLTSRSPSQARLEYRLAAEQAPEISTYDRAALPRLVQKYDDAVELLIPGDGGGMGSTVDFLSTSVAARLPATARRLDDLAVRSNPNDRLTAERRATEGLADVLAGDLAPWCTGEKRAPCLKDALDKAARLERLAPTECIGHSIHARLLVAVGDTTRALSELAAAAESVTNRTACFKELADLAALAKADSTVTLALDRIAHAGCPAPAECVDNLRFVAETEAARGNAHSALSALRRATTIAPDDDALLEQFAALAGKLEMHVDALRAYETLASRLPADPRWPARATAEKTALMGSLAH